MTVLDGPDGKCVQEAIEVCGAWHVTKANVGVVQSHPLLIMGMYFVPTVVAGKMKRQEIRSQDVSPRFRSDYVRRHP